MEAFLSRRQAAEYLSSRYFPCARATLARLAVVGGGPAFRKAGQAVLYEPQILDVWAASKIGPRVSTTAETDMPRAVGRGRPHKTAPPQARKKPSPKQAAEA